MRKTREEYFEDYSESDINDTDDMEAGYSSIEDEEEMTAYIGEREDRDEIINIQRDKEEEIKFRTELKR